MSDREFTDWQLVYHEWNPSQQPLREALCTLGNGYFATRGAAEEVSAGGPHYPGTYVAGGYNRLESEVAGRVIENEDLVNWPNWLCLTFRPPGGDWFDISTAEMLFYRKVLDVRRGVLERHVRFRHADDRITTLASRRLVHMAQPHLAAIEWTLTAENWSGTIEIRSGLDGTVSNRGVARYQGLNNQHLEILQTGRIAEDGIFLEVRTNQSHISMTQAARTQVFSDDQHANLERRTIQSQGRIDQHLTVDLERQKPLRVEKVVAIHTSRDNTISEPTVAAREAIARAGRFHDLLKTHRVAWSHIWNRADIAIQAIEGTDRYAQLVLRLHVFHLLQTTSANSIDLDAGVPARGLHGEAYRGHIFWDELFIFPFLNLRMPELTRSLLMYRYRRLDAARHMARQAGYRGAMFPWQSGSDGREETQVVHLNPNSGRWIPDHTHRQRHINATIAYNVWQYFQATDDIEFLSFYGAKMLFEIARFWASICTYNASRDRYEIHHVVGPDEFHTQYPDTDSLGLNNNAYTNVMAAWTLRCAKDAFHLLEEDRQSELIEELELTDDDFTAWDTVSQRMFVPFHQDGIISQFEGYESLREFDWQGYRDKYGDIHRLDRILESEGDDVNRYKAGKQADVLMLFYLFSAEELGQLFELLGYTFDSDTIPKTVDYYTHRTTHGSTLSRVVQSWVRARSQRQRDWELFRDALASDIDDIQGGTTSEGIHLGAMAGCVDFLQRCHTGIEMRDEVLWLNPCLPDHLGEIHLRIRYRGHWLRLALTQETLTVVMERSGAKPVRVGFREQVYDFRQGETREFALDESGGECPGG